MDGENMARIKNASNNVTRQKRTVAKNKKKQQLDSRQPTTAVDDVLCKNELRRLAKEMEIDRISENVYGNMQFEVDRFVTEVVGKAVVYAQMQHRKTLFVDDVTRALSEYNIKDYG